MNHMKGVAQLLGVEIGEEFKIEGHSGNVKYRLTEENLEYLSSYDHWFSISSTLNELLNGEYKVVKIPKPVLDDVEKKYLSYVIKPFREDVLKIAKFESINSEYKEIISVKTKNGNMIFPAFEKGSMYKGMELTRGYSLEELGI